MERYAAGDDAAFEVVYDRLAPRLAGYLAKRIRDRATVEDILQQTFLHIHRSRGSFIAGAEVLPWAFAIARRLMIDNDRIAQRERAAGLHGDGETPIMIAAQASAEEIVQAKQTAGRLDAELARLSGPQREAFELVKNEGLSLAQAAAVLGTTVTAVKLRAHRAYLALRAAVGESPDVVTAAPAAEEKQ
jgi:RNA polymerase sigma-70 factor (ECF subfamily)